jgi:hypothetical protein
MPEESLRELLVRVRERLGASGALDHEARQLLGTVMRDIERALAAHDTAASDAAGATAGHAPRLESLAVKFEAGHPALAEALRELIDALARAGI